MRLETKLVIGKDTDERVLILANRLVELCDNVPVQSHFDAQQLDQKIKTAKQALTNEVRRLIQEAYKLGVQ